MDELQTKLRIFHLTQEYGGMTKHKGNNAGN